MTGGAVPRTVDAVERVVSRAQTADDLLESLSTEVAKAVPYDGAMWFGVDPSTMLAVAPARFEHMDGFYCQPFWDGEFYEQDANLFCDLARRPVPAATLRSSTGDRPLPSARYRTFIQPQGFEDELRAVFRTGTTTWGVASLFREPGRTPFDDSDVALFSAISGSVAAALRRQAAVAPTAAALSYEPGLLLFDGEGTVVSANAAATGWLTEIYGAGNHPDWIEVFSERAVPDIEAAVP